LAKEKLLASAQKSLQKGQIGKAVKDYQKIVEADPKDIRNRQKLAELLSRGRMIDEALKEYEAVAKHYAETGFYLKSIAVYKQMQKLDATRPDFYLRLAELNEKQGLVGNALAEYKNLIAYYDKNRMFTEELKILRKMRDLEPESLNTRAKIIELALNDDPQEARQELQEVLDQLAAKKDSVRALKLLDHFLPKFPGDLLLQAAQAEAFVEKGETERGVGLLQEILRHNTNHDMTLRALARVHRREGKPRDALAIYQRLLSLQPDALDLHEAKIATALDAGEIGIAASELEGWTEAFSAAGLNDLVNAFQERLQTASGASNAGAVPAVKAPVPSPAADRELAIPAAEPVAEPVAEVGQEDLIEDLEEISEVIEEAEAEIGPTESDPSEMAPEEVSLDFLEEAPLNFLEDAEALPEPVEESPEPVNEVSAEVEVELDLDMDLDLDPEMDISDDLSLEMDLEEEIVPLDEEIIELDLEVEPAEDNEETDAPAAGDTFFDLGAEVLELDDLDIDEALEKADQDEAAAVKAAPAPKKRIKTGVEVEDTESHYNLGIAYKEMGLLDDAIGEFDKAMRSPSRTIACLTLKGICLMEKGDRKQAAEAFRLGLANPDIDESGKISLQYEMGVVYETGEQFSEALECFQHVVERDLFYRDAGERVADLRRRLGLERDSVDSGAGGGKNRVSYV